MWAAGRACPGGAGARVQALAADDRPGPPTLPSTAAGTRLAPLAPLSAAAGPHGEVVIAGADPAAGAGTLLIQGTAGGPFGALLRSPGLSAPGALATAYLGDLGYAAQSARAPGRPAAVTVQVERFFAHRLGTPARTPVGDGPIERLAVAMDFRGETLLAWAQGGQVYARRILNAGAQGTVQRLGPAGTRPQITDLLSDDYHGIVMWSCRQGSTTSVYLDYSSAGPRFGPPRLVERFSDPSALAGEIPAPRLIRLSSEGVISAWDGVQAGRWVVRVAPIYETGLHSIGTVPDTSGAEELLRGLVAGPYDEAFLLFTDSPSRPGDGHYQLMSARGLDSPPGPTLFGTPEQIASVSPTATATIDVDPDTGQAISAWSGPGGSISYAIRPPISPG